ncbi:MAG: hypothetical protein ACE145_10785 [Terriglobia bacterium]
MQARIHSRHTLPFVAAMVFLLSRVALCEDLYGPGGIRAEGVNQGGLGSCYFHAVIAALARSKPDVIRKMIQANPDGTFIVQFPDGKTETAYPEDLRYARDSGYDRSEGLWVAVLFRAYAQRVLREALVRAIDQSDLFPLVKGYARDFVASNDPLLLAYDRSIRTQVDQRGKIDRTKLETQLKTQMKPIPLSDDLKDSLAGLLESGGFFDAVAGTIKQNGELFGAYRAVGQGGIVERSMSTLAGSVRFVANESAEKTHAALEEAWKANLPLVAGTGDSHYDQLLAAGQKLPADAQGWYLNLHCYTILAYDPTTQRVRLRNPWGHDPGTDGVFDLPLATFLQAFRGIITTELQPAK